LRHASQTAIALAGGPLLAEDDLHQALTSSCASDVRVIRLAALAAFDATVPTGAPTSLRVTEVQAAEAETHAISPRRRPVKMAREILRP